MEKYIKTKLVILIVFRPAEKVLLAWLLKKIYVEFNDPIK